MLSPIIDRVRAGDDLSMEEMSGVIGTIMDGECSDDEIGQLLLGLRDKGETVDEIAGAAAALRSHMQCIHTTRTGLVDTCGTGGDGSSTFNISTAAALVVAAAGVPVAKHGNRSITSKSGSADVLRELGVNVDADLTTVQRCLDEIGICFCFAPLMHPSMKHVASVRRSLGVPTIFNMLGPLCNPAGAPYQVLGVGRPELRTKLAAALMRLGSERAVVVCGEDGLDEVTLMGRTHVSSVTAGEVTETVWSPADFGLNESTRDTLVADGPASSAAIIRDLLNGRSGPPRDIVVLNAAAALWTAGQSATLVECAERAGRAIDEGRAAELLGDLVRLSHDA